MPTDDEIAALVPLVQERLPILGAIGDLVDFLFVDGLDARPGAPRARSAGTRRRRSPACPRRATTIARGRRGRASRPTELEPPLRALAEERGWKAGDLFMAIRVAVTGRTATPPLFDTLVALGRERTLARLDRARSTCCRSRRRLKEGARDDPRRRPGLARPLQRRPGRPTTRRRSATCSAEDAEYRYHAWDEPVVGRDAIVADWLSPGGDPGQRDQPGTFAGHYEPYVGRRRPGRGDRRRATTTRPSDGAGPDATTTSGCSSSTATAAAARSSSTSSSSAAGDLEPSVRRSDHWPLTPCIRVCSVAMARTILVVDDEPTLRETLAEALEAEGFTGRRPRPTAARRWSGSGPTARTSSCST